ncbi:MAG TPA: hypothetical protein VLL77_10145, partial [Anaerolineales bacterium]|nr:hypothetical protein [Anaerolineales bacterium]
MITVTGLVLAQMIGAPMYTVSAEPNLTVAPITWNVIGLDSNNVSVGPENFPVGVRVCNVGPDPATSVTVQLIWDSANSYIKLRPTSLGDAGDPATVPINIGTLAGGNTCRDVYFEVNVTRNANARGTSRRYHIEVDSAETLPISTLTPRELFVEYLISQSRNSTTDVLLDGVSVPAGGTMALVVGNTYTIRLEAATATNGYEQIEEFINFPNTIFRINSVATTYTANDLVTPDPDAATKLYADGCGWENDPNSPNYRSCLGTGKYGGTVTVDYNVTIISGGGTTQVLNTLIYDFSGSSYHYNSDYSTSARIAAIIDPTTLSISKNFAPDPTNVNGVSVLTFTISNPNPVAISGLNFTDTFPTSPGAMVVTTPLTTSNTCGGSLLDNLGGVLAAGDA